MPFQSTLPMRGETRCPHAKLPLRSISIHSPHAGRDTYFHRQALAYLFQSTLPMRGETGREVGKAAGDGDFNPLSPCGERRTLPVVDFLQKPFQSTLPMRGETHEFLRCCNQRKFQSTLPMRGETEIFRDRLRALQFQSTLPMRGETSIIPSSASFG